MRLRPRMRLDRIIKDDSPVIVFVGQELVEFCELVEALFPDTGIMSRLGKAIRIEGRRTEEGGRIWTAFYQKEF